MPGMALGILVIRLVDDTAMREFAELKHMCSADICPEFHIFSPHKNNKFYCTLKYQS